MYLLRWRFKECIFSICEIGGNKNSRYLWQDFGKDPFLASFLPDVCDVIFVVDNQLWCGKNGRSKWTLFCPSSRTCRKSTITDCLPALPVLVIGNKQDLPGALTADEVFDQLAWAVQVIRQVIFGCIAFDTVKLEIGICGYCAKWSRNVKSNWKTFVAN